MAMKLVDMFECTDEFGTIYTIKAYAPELRYPTFSGDNSVIFGTKSLYTSDGQHVNMIDDDTYQIVVNDRLLKRIKR